MAAFLSPGKITILTGKVLNTVLGGYADKLNDGPSFINASEYDSRYFFPGNDSFLTKPAENARWKLGYHITDLTPYDYAVHDYYLGGYLTVENGFNNKINDLIDKMSCRIIALDDNSDRGVNLFATVDCIGTGNADIKRIRRKFVDLMKYKHPEAAINTVNVFSTHAHSCVDTQGLWTATLKKFRRNKKKNKTGKGTYISGADEEYMSFLTTAIADGMLSAYEDMTEGTMTYAVKDIGEEYFHNKNRKSATALVTDMTRLIFTPSDPDRKPTLIASVAAHPDVAGLPTTDGQGSGRELCGEYVYYMGKLINEAGFNFMFFNGAICAIYMSRGASNDGISFDHRYEQSIRYGYELARIALSLTKTEKEIRTDPLLYDEKAVLAETEESQRNGIAYTLWCEYWQPVAECELSPLLNIRLLEVRIPVNNPLIKIVGKLNLASYKVLKEADGTYSVVTEIGYMEWGEKLFIVTVPGEFCADLLTGGKSLTAEGSFSGTDFPFPCLYELFGKKLTAFGLANDAIGYIVPDNDFILGDFTNHYHELISLGSAAGSSVIRGFIRLKSETKR